MAGCFAKVREMIDSELISDSELAGIEKAVANFVKRPESAELLKSYRGSLKNATAHLFRERVKKIIWERKATNEILKAAPAAIRDGKYNQLLFDKADVEFGSTYSSLRQRNSTMLNQIMGDYEDIFMGKGGKSFDLDIIVAVDLLNRGETIDHLPKPIQHLALGIRALNRNVVLTLEKAGHFVNIRDDYIFRQSHNKAEIHKAQFEEWSNFIFEKLDKRKTFGEIIDPNEQLALLEDVYTSIIANNYDAGTIQSSKKRTLHFLDGESFHAYNERFGDGSMSEIIAKGLENAARTEALTRTYGPDPEKGFDFLVNGMRKQIEEIDGVEGVTRFDDEDIIAFHNKKMRDNLKNTLFQKKSSEMGMAAKVLHGVRMLQNVSKLMGAVFSTPIDFAVATHNYSAKTGEGYWKGMGVMLDGWTKGLSAKNRKIFGQHLQVFLNAEQGLNRFMDDELIGGRVEDMTSKVMKLSFLEQTTSINRTSSAIAFASHLSDQAGKGFDELNPRLQKDLDTFGITGKEWELLRQVGEDVEGIRMITPESIDALGLKPAAKEKLRSQLANYYNHNAKFGAIEAGYRARATLYRGMDPNSSQGQAIRALFQFKTYSVEAVLAMHEIGLAGAGDGLDLGAQINPFDKKFSEMKNMHSMELMGSMLAHSFVMAGVGLWAKDLASGKTPRDLTTFDNVTEMMTRGVMPLEFQYLISTLKGDQSNRFGGGILHDLAGPTFAQGADMVGMASDMANNVRKGSPIMRGVQGRLENLVRSNIPGQTNPMINVVLRRYFLDGLTQKYSPRYNKRVQKRLDENGQDYYIDVADPRR